jgi:hypothetical protein
VAVNDLNNDNHLDIVTVFVYSDNIGVLLGYGNGIFGDTMTYSTGHNSYPIAVVVSDFNNDHQLDIAVSNSGTNNVGILLGYGNGSFATIMTFSTGDGSFPLGIAVGDFNNDHRLDIVVANFGTNTVGILLGYGNGT